jgi:hypothetical protein
MGFTRKLDIFFDLEAVVNLSEVLHYGISLCLWTKLFKRGVGAPGSVEV